MPRRPLQKFHDMADSKNTGLWLGLSALALATGAFFMFKNRDRSETKKSDNTTADITDNETQQAMQLYNLLGVSDTFGWGLKTFYDVPEEKVLNLLLSVTNWKKLQEKFRGLCNNEYSLTKALNDALDADEYRRAIQYASAPKVVTTAQAVLTTLENPVRMTTVPAGTLVGALVEDGAQSYVFINAIDDDENEIKAFVYKTQAKLLQP